MRRVCGENNILALSGEDHKRIRGALVSFLKPEALKEYVGKMDEAGSFFTKANHDVISGTRDAHEVMPLIKTLTFNIVCSLIYGIEQGARRDPLRDLFQNMIKGMLLVLVNLPFTRFNHSLRERAKMKTILMALINNSALLFDEEIEDNAVIIMIGGYDTSSILLTFLIRLLANEPSVYATIIQEQEEITKTKTLGELLKWDDLSKIKYTWRVVMETLRITTPGFCSFKRVLKDIEFGEYLIPKGGQLVWAASMTHMDETIFPNPSKIDPTCFEMQAPSPP
ncbi:hypothetical protein CsSME_00030844 [Camellia sinensis var. sinensis]